MAWTLSFEIFFYGLLVLSLTVRHPFWYWGLFLVPSLLALFRCASIGSVNFAEATSPFMLLASPYQWEFLLGSSVAVLTSRPLPWLAALQSSRFLKIGLLLLAGVLLLWPFASTFSYRVLLLLVLAILILLSAEGAVQFPGLRPLAWLGGISYSLYLVHNPLQSLVIRVALRLEQPEGVAAVLLVLVPLFGAFAYFRIVERWSLSLMQRAALALQGH